MLSLLQLPNACLLGLPYPRHMQLQVHLANVQGLPLAVKALHELKRQGYPGASLARLVVAGGYDKRLAENREHFLEVQQLVTDLHMEDEVCLFSVIISTYCTWCHPQCTCLYVLWLSGFCV